MTVNLSTGLRNGMLNATGLTSAFANGVLYIYSGPQPINADQAVQGTLLAIITNSASAFVFGTSSNGLNLAVPVNGVITKTSTQSWQGTGLAAGVAGWGRLMGNASDALGTSTVLPRMDWSIANTGADMNVANVNVTVAEPMTVDVWQYTLPPN
jgi:hypothetical protein